MQNRLNAALCVLLLATVTPRVLADEVVYANGHHERVTGLVKDATGRWTIQRQGHPFPLRPGDVAAVIDGDGNETETIPELTDGQPSPAAAASLVTLRDLDVEMWYSALDALGDRPTRRTFEALVAQCDDPSPELRRRAITGLTAQHTKESVLRAARATLDEKDRDARRAGASDLYAVRAIFARADGLDLLREAFELSDRDVRCSFASAAPLDFEPAIAVLRNDGLKSSDHHMREFAALELAERGDDSGIKILASMLSRSRLPGVHDAELEVELRTNEKVAICRALGQLGTKAARAALEKALKDPLEAVRLAAEEAITGIAKDNSE